MKDERLRMQWQGHQEATKHDPPNPLLLEALPYFPDAKTTHRKALELGNGGLKDTRVLLDLGFEVTGIDAITPPEDVMAELASPKFHQFKGLFDEIPLPEKEFDVIAAFVSLPFNPPDVFARVFEKMKRALRPGGIFCGHLFGVNDGWKDDPNMTFHTRGEVDALLADMEVISNNEREKDGYTREGKPKYWHRFFIIAKKPE